MFQAVGDTVKMCAKCMSVPSEKFVSVLSAKKNIQDKTLSICFFDIISIYTWHMLNILCTVHFIECLQNTLGTKLTMLHKQNSNEQLYHV
jgi:hypothetical protein